jgi:hypothetical protein
VVDAPHEIEFISETQRLVTFQFKDNSGTETIIPTRVQIKTDGLEVVNVVDEQVWVSGQTFTLESVIWQNAEVKPSAQTPYQTKAPLDVTVLCRVYDSRIVVNNFYGSPISGVTVNVTLVNQTSLRSVTASDGSLDLGLIPQGTLEAAIEYESSNLKVTGNAQTNAVIVATAPLTLKDALPIVIISTVVVLAVCLALLVYRKRRKQSTETAKISP